MKLKGKRVRLSPLADLLLLLLLFSYTPTATAQVLGPFLPTGNMTTPRTGHTATLLLNGKVLITGGSAVGVPAVPERSAELYTPSTRTFSATGDMTTARFGHTATLLNDGRILIVGGGGSASAELYDPSTGAFSPTGNMSTTRWGYYSATLLKDGKVLIAGGTVDFFSRAEVYDPSAGTFTSVGNTTAILWGHTATLLNDGRVLMTGGNSGEGSGLEVAELYDPSSGIFSRTGNMTAPRQEHTATLLNDGRVLIAGGDNDTSGWDYYTAELYDPLSGRFTETGSMMGTGPNFFAGRASHTATLLRDGRVLMAGSTKSFCDSRCHLINDASAETYDPVTRTFSPQGNMTAPRAFHTTTLLFDGAVLIAGGTTGLIWWEGGPSTAAAEIYVPSVLIPAPVVTDLRFDRTNAVAGTSYSANVSGSNLTTQTFFDVRFTSPGSNTSDVVLNWQRGVSASHDVTAGVALGNWTINGVRVHETEMDHTGSFFPVSATITVLP
jgi:hypothetical protein